ncbi:MAG: thiolase family protein [Betaproteobacteria bacterium]|jgi:acetyl-CoA acetyltransferase family protein|nr:MAG: thiolase family protein [Betaproteobacteria bacterium]
MKEAVILDAVRSPFGRRGGILRERRPDSLLADVIDGLIDRVGIAPDKIEDVIDGTVTLAGEQGANPARLAVLLSKLPVEVSGVSLNRMCGSSQQAVHFAAQAVASGDMDYVIGCGVESMTRAPMFLDIGLGREISGFEVLNPELLKRHELIHQGESAERISEKWSLSRDDVDEYAKRSHRLAAKAQQDGENREIVPLQGVSPEAEIIIVDRDEGVRAELDEAKIASLKPAFRAEGKGVVTAANSSQISDGASAVLVADGEVAVADGFTPKARFRARVALGSDPMLQLTGVIPATQRALKKAGLSIRDLDWIEINEAFASVVLSWAKELNPDMEKVNPWGGAIAHGHPLGATGGGLMSKMLSGLEATDGTLGLQVMCIGHGQATATIIERIQS